MPRKSIALILLAGSGFVLVAGAWATRAFTQDVDFSGRVAAPPVIVQPQSAPPGAASAPGISAPPTGAPAAGLGLLSTAPTGPTGSAMPGGAPVNNLAVRVFPLKHASATAVAQILTSLVPDGETRIAVDPRTNSLVVRCHDGELAGVNALVTELDSNRPSTAVTTVAVGTPGLPGFTTVPVGPSGMPDKLGIVPLAGGGVAEPQSLNDARRQYELADTTARQLGLELQRAGRNAAREEELRRHVRDAFAARQRLMRQEIVELQRRLIAVQEAVDLRDRVAEQIIERRAVELSVPEVQWDSPARSSGLGSSVGRGALTTPPVGLPSSSVASPMGPPSVPAGAGGNPNSPSVPLSPESPLPPPTGLGPMPAPGAPAFPPGTPGLPSTSPSLNTSGAAPQTPAGSSGSPGASAPVPAAPPKGTDSFDPFAPTEPGAGPAPVQAGKVQF